MEQDGVIHPDDSHSALVSGDGTSSDSVPADCQADLQKVSSGGDCLARSCTEQLTGEKLDSDAGCKTRDVVDSETVTAHSQQSPPHTNDESDDDDEFLSASDGEEDDDDEDDEKIEKWAESLSDWSSNVNTSSTTEMPFADEKLESSSLTGAKNEQEGSFDLNSDVNSAFSPETVSADGKNEDLGQSLSSNSTGLQSETVSSGAMCQSDSPGKVSKTLPEDSEELERMVAAATVGNDDENETDDEGEGEKKSEENQERGDGESRDRETLKEEEIEEELERKRQEAEDALTEEERQRRLVEAVKVKTRGNNTFKNGQYSEALELYTESLELCPLKYVHQRAIMLSNRAACRIREDDYETAIKDCSKSIDLDPAYIKAYFRRADAYEKVEKLDEALKDHQKIVELDQSQTNSYHACLRLEKEIHERNEKLKTEMMGKLKDLGNMVLRPFGLSTNNFQLQQDPNTGSYSVQFVQTPPTNGC